MLQRAATRTVRTLSVLRSRWYSGDVLSHRPTAPGDVRKHTFSMGYFGSPACQQLAKVSHRSVTIKGMGVSHAAFASRLLYEGDIIERGIMRNVGDVLCPFVLREGVDFQPLGPARTPSYVASGLAMLYQTAEEGFNCEMRLVPCVQPGAVEFEIRALKDIPEGELFLRRSRGRSALSIPAPDVNYTSVHQMSDEDVDTYISMRRQLDAELAAEAQTEQEELHEEAIRRHVRLTREGRLPVVGGADGGPLASSVVLPHPTWPGYGVFAKRKIKAGDVIEWGLQRKVKLDGDSCPYIFTWNANGRRLKEGNVWTHGGGSSMFYNSDVPPNMRLYRLFSGFRYLFVAKNDIQAGEELVHLYASSSWRQCFVEDNALPKLLPLNQEVLASLKH